MAGIMENEEQVVVCQLAEETYGINIANVREIITMQKITRVPRTPDFIEGIINLRGRILPVIDLRKRFGLAVSEYTRATRIIEVETSGKSVGIIVDGVSEVLRISRDWVEPPSPFIVSVDSEYIRGVAKVDDRLIILLDLDKVLSPSEKAELERVGGARD